MIRLRVWMDSQAMGWFGHEGIGYFFEYDDAWLAQPTAFAIAPQFALIQQRYQGDAVKVFFENLLPEGQILEDVVAALHHLPRGASGFEVLGALGGDLSGAMSLLPEGVSRPTTQNYSALTFADLSARLHNQSTTPLLISADTRGTMSLAGAQAKLGVRFDPTTNALQDSVGASPTTHIIKPDTRQARYQPSAINEYACVKLARALKLPVPDVWLLRVPEAVYVVQRYDRAVDAGRVQSVHQIDGCQLLGVGSSWKYQRQAGWVSLSRLTTALRGVNVHGRDLLSVLRWVMFNYLIGNSDAHAKNLSLQVGASGYRLAPFYDLLCVKAYGDNEMALFIGDESRFDAVGLHSWEALCADCGFGFKPAMRELGKMADKLLPAWQQVIKEIQDSPTCALTTSEQAMLERMTGVFTQHREWVQLMLGLGE